jgi:ABC-2 type transport system permease protein
MKSLLQTLYTEITVAHAITCKNIKANASMKTAFILQMVGMMLNNLAFVLLWLLFTDIFGEINGWGKWEVIGLQGLVALSYGICYAFFRGGEVLPSYIDKGVFDTLLVSPRNLYLRILTLGSRMSAFGDLLYGIILLCVFCVGIGANMPQVILLLLLTIPSAFILINFTLLCSCVGFFIPDSQELSKNLLEYMFGPAMYPSGLYPPLMRFVFTFVLPSIVIGGLPIETITHPTFSNIAIIWLIAVWWFFVTHKVLAYGIKRYESGNLTGARVLD